MNSRELHGSESCFDTAFAGLFTEDAPLSDEQATGGRRDENKRDAVSLLDEIREAIDQDPKAARAAALRLVTFLTPAAPEAKCVRGGLAPWQKLKIDRFLRQRLGDSIGLEQLAEQIPLSVSHFCRAFKESFGDTPHMYIIRLRLELAKRLMLTTDEPLSQVALACGMADQAHLSKLFRRWLCETPSTWRRRNLTDYQVQVRRHHSTASDLVQRAGVVQF